MYSGPSVLVRPQAGVSSPGGLAKGSGLRKAPGGPRGSRRAVEGSNLQT